MDQQPQPVKRRRGFLDDPVRYKQKTAELLLLLDKIPHLQPNRDEWDIEGDWTRAATIHFIDKVYSLPFELFATFDCRVVKLINLQQPAVRLTFFQKHSYFVKRDEDIAPDLRDKLVSNYLNLLTTKIEVLRSNHHRISLPADVVKTKRDIAYSETERQAWQDVYAQPDNYELAQSNFEQDHMYTTVNLKYMTCEPSVYDNCQVHLLNNQRDKLNNIVQFRHNVIFVDRDEIRRGLHPHQHKIVHQYLQRFTLKAHELKDRLYARHRDATLNLTNAVDGLSQASGARLPTVLPSAQPNTLPSSSLPLFPYEP